MSGYTFFLDGQPHTPEVYSMNGTPDEPAEGDVIVVQFAPLLLGKPARGASRAPAAGG